MEYTGHLVTLDDIEHVGEIEGRHGKHVNLQADTQGKGHMDCQTPSVGGWENTWKGRCKGLKF